MIPKRFLAVCIAAVFSAASSPNASAATIRGPLLQKVGSGSSVVLLVTSGAKVTRVKANASTVVSRGEKNAGLRSAGLPDILPGDQLTIETTSSGTARSVAAQYSMIHGQVKTLLKKSILLADGRLIELNPNARVVTENGTGVALSVLRRGDYLTVKLNPVTEEAWRIVLSDQPAPLMITAISHNATHPLKTGETLVVTVEGTPSARADFAIDGVTSGLKMSEVTPGRYVGRFTVGTDTRRTQSAPVIAHLSKGGRTVGPIQAGRLVAIAEEQTPIITVREVARARNQAQRDDPVATRVSADPLPVISPASDDPIIISRPSRNALVHNPLIIVGRAKPKSKLRATVSYSNDMVGLLRLEGKLCNEEMTADSEGSFRSGPIHLPQAYAGRDLEITVKVEMLGSAPLPKPVVVKVRRK